jgi:hypothetical protein
MNRTTPNAAQSSGYGLTAAAGTDRRPRRFPMRPWLPGAGDHSRAKTWAPFSSPFDVLAVCEAARMKQP